MRFLIVCFILSSPCLAVAQPFGIVMGQQIDTLKAEKTSKEFTYMVTPPKTHAEMEAYVVIATPGQGVCSVRGIGINHANDAFGFKIKDIAASIRKQVNATYGLSTLNDFLEPGSIWREANEWAIAVSKDERAYQFTWGKKTGPVISNNVVEILETVGAADRDTTYLTLQFRFNNYKLCKAEIDTAEAKAF